jgi:serine phosphatase RsbU (regulator of sigma subunit)
VGETGDQTINLPARMAVPAAASPVHALVMLSDDAPTTRVPLDAFPVVVGRSETCGLVLDDVAVSRQHCRLDHIAERIVLTDLGSTNGTYLDGTLLGAAAALEDGTLIRIGGQMMRYHRRSRDETEAAASLDQELSDASDYVAAILPPPIRSGPVQAEWFFRPSTRLGGDAFGYRWLDDRWFALFLLDVAGHGAAAALHAVSVANVLRQRMLPDADFQNPASVLQSLNRMFPMEQHADRFFTIWYGVYDRITRHLHFASAGHHPAFLLPPGQETQPLTTRNPAIGIAPDHRMTAGRMALPAGSALHLFSDGVFEAAGQNGEQVGLPAIVALLPTASGIGGAGLLHDAVRRLAGPGPLDDDFSSILLRFP